MIEKVILAGYGGQGMMLFGKLLAQSVMMNGKYVTFYPSYGTEVRGGKAFYHVIISTDYIFSPVIDEADTLIIMNNPSFDKFQDCIVKNTHLFYNSSLVHLPNDLPNDIKIFKIPATEIANDIGNVVASNMVMMGAFNCVKNLIPRSRFLYCLRTSLTGRKADLFEINKLAMERGEQYVQENYNIKYDISQDE